MASSRSKEEVEWILYAHLAPEVGRPAVGGEGVGQAPTSGTLDVPGGLQSIGEVSSLAPQVHEALPPSPTKAELMARIAVLEAHGLMGSMWSPKTATKTTKKASGKGASAKRKSSSTTPKKRTTGTGRVTKKKSPARSVSLARKRPLQELFEANFIDLTHEEKARLLLPLLGGIDPETGRPLGKPGALYGLMDGVNPADDVAIFEAVLKATNAEKPGLGDAMDKFDMSSFLRPSPSPIARMSTGINLTDELDNSDFINKSPTSATQTPIDDDDDIPAPFEFDPLDVPSTSSARATQSSIGLNSAAFDLSGVFDASAVPTTKTTPEFDAKNITDHDHLEVLIPSSVPIKQTSNVFDKSFGFHNASAVRDQDISSASAYTTFVHTTAMPTSQSFVGHATSNLHGPSGMNNTSLNTSVASTANRSSEFDFSGSLNAPLNLSVAGDAETDEFFDYNAYQNAPLNQSAAPPAETGDGVGYTTYYNTPINTSVVGDAETDEFVDYNTYQNAPFKPSIVPPAETGNCIGYNYNAYHNAQLNTSAASTAETHGDADFSTLFNTSIDWSVPQPINNPFYDPFDDAYSEAFGNDFSNASNYGTMRQNEALQRAAAQNGQRRHR